MTREGGNIFQPLDRCLTISSLKKREAGKYIIDITRAIVPNRTESPKIDCDVEGEKKIKKLKKENDENKREEKNGG